MALAAVSSSQEGDDVEVVGRENPHLERDRLPLENALVVSLGPDAKKKPPAPPWRA